MSGNYRKTAGVDGYYARITMRVPIFSFSDYIRFFDFFSAPGDNIPGFHSQVSPDTQDAQFCCV